jgi:hypothetical protein
VAGDDITRDRPDAKFLWLMCVKQRTKWISCKVRDAGGSSVPFGKALKSNTTNRMSKNFSFCKKNKKTHTLHNSIPNIYLFIELCFIPLTLKVYMTLSTNIATSINRHVSFSFSWIILSGLLIGIVLSLCTSFFHNLVTFASLLVSINCAAFSYWFY